MRNSPAYIRDALRLTGYNKSSLNNSPGVPTQLYSLKMFFQIIEGRKNGREGEREEERKGAT